LDLVLKIAPISDHVAKSRRDRPRDCGDLALNKKIKEETAAKHKGRGYVIATGGPNKINICVCVHKYMNLEHAVTGVDKRFVDAEFSITYQLLSVQTIATDKSV